MKPRAAFRVIEFTNASGTHSFRVTGTKPDGARVRENFGTLEEATGRRQELETEALNVGTQARLRQTRLTPDQIIEAERAFADLDGKPMIDAIRFYLENYREPQIKVTVEKAFQNFIESKRKANKRHHTIRNLEVRVGFLVGRHGDKLVSEILPDHLTAIIHRPGRSPVTANNDRRALSGFFTWATEQRYCVENPMLRIGAIEFERDTPEILPFDAVQRLVSAAAAYKDGVVLPYVALGLFAAIRPTELSRLTWNDIDLDSATVTVGAKIAKLRQRRIVELARLTGKKKLTPNIVDWLSPHKKKTPIVGVNWRRDFDAVKELAGYGTKTEKKPHLKPWTPDIMRHTGISNHLAYFEHEGKTAMWAGNSPDVIQRHYKGLVKRPEAEQFWSIRPDVSVTNVVRMQG